LQNNESTPSAVLGVITSAVAPGIMKPPAEPLGENTKRGDKNSTARTGITQNTRANFFPRRDPIHRSARK
jgi:hypothetical protein